MTLAQVLRLHSEQVEVGAAERIQEVKGLHQENENVREMEADDGSSALQRY